MAKIHIELDTAVPDDAALVVAFGQALNSLGMNTPYEREEAHTDSGEMSDADAKMYAEDEEKNPQDYAPPAKRTRRTKAQMEADALAAAQATGAASGSATNGAGPGPTAPTTVKLSDVEAIMRKLMEGDDEAGPKMIAKVREITGGASMSPKHCDPIHLPAIHAAFSAML